MATHTNTIVERFDFSEAMALTVPQRMTRSIEKARERVAQSGYQRFSDFPCVPSVGATETELAQLEADLGRSLPSEYRAFLSHCTLGELRRLGSAGRNGQRAKQPLLSIVHLTCGGNPVN